MEAVHFGSEANSVYECLKIIYYDIMIAKSAGIVRGFNTGGACSAVSRLHEKAADVCVAQTAGQYGRLMGLRIVYGLGKCL